MKHSNSTFGQLAVGDLFRRNGMLWRKGLLPSGRNNARYMGTDGRYSSVEFKDFQEVTHIPARVNLPADLIAEARRQWEIADMHTHDPYCSIPNPYRLDHHYMNAKHD